MALGAALTALTLAAAGCTGSDPVDDGKDAAEGYDPNAKVTIQWWTGQTEDMQKVSEDLAKEYMKLHPNVTIESSTGASTTDELLTKLSAGFTGGNYPDISYAFGSWATQLAESGRTQNLKTFVGTPEIAWDDFPASARATATVGDKVIGFPAIVDNLALIYNKKLFDAAGLAHPTDDWSWDDFRAAAKKLTNPATNTYGTAYSVSGSEDTTWHLWPLLWQRGGKIIDGKKPTFNSDAGVQALESLRQMAVDDKSMYLDQTDEKYQPLFNDGHVGMVMTGPWVLHETQEAGVDYGVVNLPGLNGDHQTVSGPDLWVLFNKKDPNRAGASRDFIKWLTSKEIDPKWTMANGNLPLRASEKNTPEFATYVKDYPGAQKFFDNLQNCKQPRPTVPGYVEMSGYVGDAVSKVLQGAAKPKEALDEAAKKSASALEG
ncbi:ABC transporter substrate-binding protein [Virgisporangium aliadipatigenens]|uniref:ABC transporter substrate-binding protein n=2 Tax=Virgisporangium aliadipatigenens TaxID=741659 RepID=A0A8J3YK45_9ACTN|nr:ABC transporter substrate-binding protein [Virgisporangium aliadipatigenens]